MAWKRSKDGGWDYDCSAETAFRKAVNKVFGDEPLRNQKLEQLRERRLTSNADIDVSLNLKERLKQRIKKRCLR